MTSLKYNEMLPIDRLEEILANGAAEDYANAHPFAHGVFDNVFDPDILNSVIKEFDEGEKYWKEFSSKYEKKLQMSKDESLGEVSRALVHNLNSAPFLSFLERLTGIPGLISDPYLDGAGLHKIPPGGKLGVHVDFNGHKVMNVYRRLNVLIYLNHDWLEEYGGHFELWSGNKGSCEKRILPIFNRMAIFSTTSYSFHGHPEPLTCPEDRSRISLALYYYTAKDSGDQKKDLHSTVFITESGKTEELGAKVGLITRAARKMKRLLSH